jgi:hypothetical protein
LGSLSTFADSAIHEIIFGIVSNLAEGADSLEGFG